MGCGAQLEQHVEIVIGDELGGLAVRDVLVPAETVDPLGDLLLGGVLLALVPGVAEDLEPAAVIVLEEGDGEVGHRMPAQVRGHVAHPDLAAGRARRRVDDGSPGGGGVGQPTPDAVLFDQFQPVLRRADARQVSHQRRVPASIGPGAADLGEGAEGLQPVIVGDADQQLVDDLEVAGGQFGLVQNLHHGAIGGLKIAALVAGPVAPQALGVGDPVIDILWGELDGPAEVFVGPGPVVVGQGATQLEVKPGGVWGDLQHVQHLLLGLAHTPRTAQHGEPGLLKPGVAWASLEPPVQGLEALDGAAGVGVDRGQVQPGVDHVGLHPGGEVEALEGLVEILCEPVGAPQLPLELGVGGRRPDELREDLDGAGVLGVVENISEVLLDGVAAGVQPQGLLEGVHRLGVSLEPAQGDAEDVPELRIPGMSLHRAPSHGLGHGVIAVADQDGAQVAVDPRRGVRVRLQLLGRQALALVAPSGLERGFGFGESIEGHRGSGEINTDANGGGAI